MRLGSILALLLTLLRGCTTPAWAWSQSFDIAGADIPQGIGLCTDCTVVTEFPLPGIPITVMQIPQNVPLTSYVIVWKQVPDNIASPNMGFTLERMTPDPSPTGRLCDTVCAGVIRPNAGNVATIDLSACMPLTSEPMRAQWNPMETSFGGVSLVPRTDDGSACTVSGPENCRGGWLAIQIVRANAADCVVGPGSSNTIDYKFVAPTFTY